ncbi:hypothetical protein CH373_09795 [Leptospira perolatii]|uniref:Uncharacterized protein n=1 Tax=Leptospira perolatii TaxID=2023191 RepID=A0A2M9ZML4_9LEPT|nr:hypothetical protein [Leptospira perolatii]PJZ70077.1 hypothetical protein CH360_07540 [Leptospira perolatii]PJZ73265.1 hypothetical protein CH373_09795 [Leptospira perolatii]
MALTKEQKQEFQEKLVDFRNFLEDLKKETNLLKSQSRKEPKMEPYFNIALSVNSIKNINTCLLINEISVSILDLKSDTYLNQGRKEIYSAISYMEKVVGVDYESGLAENKDLLLKIQEFNPIQRLNFVKGLRLSTNNTIEAFGANSKWKWSFPEIHFKIAILSKNLFDFRAFEKERDLENPYFYPRQEHYNLVLELCNHAAQEYRAKFDLSTQDASDLKKSIVLLEVNRKILQTTGETEDLGKTKTLIESLKEKVELIEAEKEKKKKKK